jgi:hypothetical protein
MSFILPTFTFFDSEPRPKQRGLALPGGGKTGGAPMLLALPATSPFPAASSAGLNKPGRAKR